MRSLRIIVFRHHVCLRVRNDVVDGVTETNYAWALGKPWPAVSKWLARHRIAWTSHGWKLRRDDQLITKDTPLVAVKGKLRRAPPAPNATGPNVPNRQGDTP